MYIKKLEQNKIYLRPSRRNVRKTSRYPRGQTNSRDKQVNIRARPLPAEYHGLLRKLDSVFHHGTRPGEVGHCQARSETLGGILELVVGAFGEVSTDMDRLITALAESSHRRRAD